MGPVIQIPQARDLRGVVRELGVRPGDDIDEPLLRIGAIGIPRTANLIQLFTAHAFQGTAPARVSFRKEGEGIPGGGRPDNLVQRERMRAERVVVARERREAAVADPPGDGGEGRRVRDGLTAVKQPPAPLGWGPRASSRRRRLQQSGAASQKYSSSVSVVLR